MNYTVNISDIEASLIQLGGQAKAKAIQDHILRNYCASAVPKNYQSERSFRQTVQRKIEDYCPQADGFNSAKKSAKFVRLERGLYRLNDLEKTEFALPEEVLAGITYVEGATQSVLVNTYERSTAARKACISHYGARCSVCGFDFEKRYGALGKGFIHVHHVVKLASIGKSYAVNPIRDLRPVCANCHAMLHRTDPPMEINDLKAVLCKD